MHKAVVETFNGRKGNLGQSIVLPPSQNGFFFFNHSVFCDKVMKTKTKKGFFFVLKKRLKHFHHVLMLNSIGPSLFTCFLIVLMSIRLKKYKRHLDFQLSPSQVHVYFTVRDVSSYSIRNLSDF